MSKTTAFKFEAFDQPLRHSDFREFYRTQSTAILARYGVVLFGGLVVAPAFVAAAELFGVPLLMENAPPLLHIWLVSMMLWTTVPTLIWARKFRRDVRLAKFCQANDLVYHSQTRNLRINGAPFRNYHSSMTAPLISGVFDGEKFTIGRYSVINEKNDGNIDIRRPFTFARSSLPRTVPHIILKNRRSRVVPLPNLRRASAQLKLEGDYGDKFTLYCPKDYERDALYIFTPDVISAIYDFASDAEIELVDDNLFIYTRDAAAFRQPEKLAELFDVVARLDQRFDRQTKRYRDDRAATGANVASTARRLRLRNWSWPTFAYSLIIAAIFAVQILRALNIEPVSQWVNGLLFQIFPTAV
jgi:hypothetical protein